MDSWMRDNFDILANRRLNEIVLPGTHDSAAYLLAPVDGVNRRDWLLSVLARFAQPCLRPWTLTQHMCVHRQLSEVGIRFLDVRVAWDESRKDIVTAHTFACAPLKAVLYDILDFLLQSIGEVVVLSVRPDWPHREQFTPMRCAALLTALSSTCRGYLFPRQTQLPTLSDMVASGRRLICFVEGIPPTPIPHQPQPPNVTVSCSSSSITPSTASPSPTPLHSDVEVDIWVSAGCRTLWAESDTAEGTVSGLLDRVAQLRRDGGRGLREAALWYLSAAVTPTPRSIVRDCLAHPRSAGLRRVAAELEARQLPRLLAEGLAGIGAVCLDHPSPQATAAVVRLNLPNPRPGKPKPGG